MTTSALVLVGCQADLIALVAGVPELSTEAAHRIVENFKTYNAKACTAVLGAGAMQVRI